MKKICMLSLGGTIAMLPSDGGGVVPQLTGDQLLDGIPRLREIADISVRSVFSKPGAHLAFQDLDELASIIDDVRASGADGVVITQGTDTIEETAFAIDCLTAAGSPIVVTGAMRHPTSPGADGPANLVAAIATACAPQAFGIGTMVVMNDEIHAARFCRKVHTASTAAFASPQVGPLGWLREGSVRIALRPSSLPAIGRMTRSDSKVGCCILGLGDDGDLISLAHQAGMSGIVLAATGAGHVSEKAALAVERACRDIPVILSSRTGAGETFRETYGFAGSERDLLSKGAIAASYLDPVKARMLLTLLLNAGASRTEISRTFDSL